MSDRAAADITEQADSYAQAQGLDSNQINRERLVADLARSLAERAQGIARDAAALEAMLERASERLLAAEDVTSGPLEPALEAALSESDPEPEQVAVAPDAAGESERLLQAVVGEAERARRVSDHFGSPPESAGRFTPRKSAPERPASTAAPQKTPSREGLRLLATQMAAAGSNREEIADRLRSEFGVTDATSVLNDVLGPERGSDG